MQLGVKLTGALARTSPLLAGVQFKHGHAVLSGQPHEVGYLLTYLQRCHGVVESSDAHAVDQAHGHRKADGNGGVHAAPVAQAVVVTANDGAAPVSAGRPPDGGSGQGATYAVSEKLRKAIQELDPATDEHWTGTGKPMLNAIEKFYGSSGVTRADVQAALPGYDREAAKAAQKKGE